MRAGAAMKPLEDAARSRGEADWIVGMNATRAYSVRFGGRETYSLWACPDPDTEASRRP